MNNLAVAYRNAGLTAEAITLHEQNLEGDGVPVPCPMVRSAAEIHGYSEATG
jgi:hypothetical protein